MFPYCAICVKEVEKVDVVPILIVIKYPAVIPVFNKRNVIFIKSKADSVLASILYELIRVSDVVPVTPEEVV